MTKLHNVFVSYEAAYTLSEKNFDCECFGYYDSNGHLKPKSEKNLISGITKIDLHALNILAPTHQQVIDWFFEKHNIYIMYSSDKEIIDGQILHNIKYISCKK